MFSKYSHFIAAVILFQLTINSWSQEVGISAQDFASGEEFTNVRISPDGNKLLFVSKDEDDNTAIIVSTLSGGEETAYRMQFGRNGIRRAYWYDDERIVYLADNTNRFFEDKEAIPISSGYYISDWDGSNIITINHSIINILPNEPDYVLTQYGEDIYKLNIKTSEEEKIVFGPIYARNYKMDKNGVFRFASGGGNSIWSNTVVRSSYYRKSEIDDWEKIYDKTIHLGTGKINEDYFNSKWRFLSFSDDPNQIYIIAIDENNNDALFLYDVSENRKIRKIAGNDKFDIIDADFDENYQLEAYYYNGDYPKRIAVTDKMKRLDNIFESNFPDAFVRIQNHSKDKNKYIIRVSSPTDPGSYYLLDFSTGKIIMIGYIFRSLDVEKLSPVKAVTYPARDGLQIHGYLSVPKGSSGENMPTIILVNSDITSRFYWGFNTWAGFLNTRGYNVLQINQRGTFGYGNDYTMAVFFEVGGAMINDINDGADWMFDQGYADPNKICIMGDNFGGYFALQANINKPSFYNCTVSINPIVNFVNYVKIRKTNYIEKRGVDFKAMSPYFRTDDYKTPLLYLRTPKSGYTLEFLIPKTTARYDYYLYEKFLKKLKKSYANVDYIDLRDQGEKYTVKFFQEIENFLAKHLKEP
ncbi:MAG TPA: prolyl oligopeptidase family serine peptidase [Emcibacteraceae bacterium]|nr:prolyl oligopeptidase family serine peptidase [Emcibacteraceae bacterium]